MNNDEQRASLRALLLFNFISVWYEHRLKSMAMNPNMMPGETERAGNAWNKALTE